MFKFILNGLLKVWGYLRTSGKINPPESIPNQKKLIEDFTVLNEMEIQGFLINEQKVLL